MSSTTPPGWYDDGQGGRRWWDGTAWAAPGQGPAETQGFQSYEQQPSYAQPSGPPPAYAPQQGYGQQPYGQQPAPKKRTGLIIGIVVALVLVGGGILAAVLLLGGSDGPSSDDPTATVQAFVDAARDGDCDAIDDLLTAEGKKQFPAGDCEEGIDAAARGEGIDPDDVEIEVGDATEDGDTAIVPVSYTAPGEESFDLDYSLVKQDGAWLIDGLDLGGLGDVELPDVPGGTDLPDLPDVPSFDPGDIPTDFLTDFPTDIPTDPEDLQSYLDELESQFSDFPTE